MARHIHEPEHEERVEHDIVIEIGPDGTAREVTEDDPEVREQEQQ